MSPPPFQEAGPDSAIILVLLRKAESRAVQEWEEAEKRLGRRGVK